MLLNFNRWFNKSKLYLCFFLSVIIWGMFGIQDSTWRNWEDASVFLTLILTFIVYYNGFWGEKNFKGIQHEKIGYFFLVIIGTLIGIVALLINALHYYFPQYISYEMPRFIVMPIILVISILLSYIDYQVGKNNYIFMMKLFYYSDLPIIITFLILSIYSILYMDSKELEPFYSGAIAFQMMISILLSSLFVDKDIIPNLSVEN